MTRFREEGNPAGIKQVVVGGLLVQGCIGAGLMVVAWILAKPIAVLFAGGPGGAVLVRLICLHGVLLLVFKMGIALLLGLQSIGARALSDLLRVMACVTTAAVLLGAGYGVEGAAWAYVAGVVAGVATQAVALGLWHRDVLAARFSWRFDLVAQVFRSGKYLSVAYGGVLVFSQMDTVMLGLLSRDLGAAGAYQVAVPTIMILYGLLLPVGVALMPMVTTLLHRGEKTLLAAGIARMYETAGVLILPGTVLMACFSDVLMTVLWGKAAPGARGAFDILAIGSVFYFTCYVNLQVLAGMGRARTACALIAGALGANLVLNAVLIAFFGIRGAAAATVLSHVLATGLGVAAIRRDLAVPLRTRTAAAALAGSVVIAGFALAVRRLDPFVTHPVLVSAVTGVVCYGTLIGILEILGVARLRESIEVVLRKS